MFDIIPRIRFRTRVLSISKLNLHDADQPWSIKIEQMTETSSSIETLNFDFVVIANGLFSHYQIPVFRGEEKFSGSIMHAGDVKRREQLGDKNILVVGGSKSAIDMATNAATVTNRCDMIFRRIHMILPLKIVRGCVPLRYLLCRFYCFLGEPYPLAPHGRLFQLAHRYFPRFFTEIGRMIAADFIASNKPDLYADGIFRPQGAWPDGLIGFPTQPIFTELKRQNRIRGHLASIDEILDSNTVRLSNGEVLSPVDTIICGTSRYLHLPFFSDADARTMGLPNETSHDVNLYRRIVPVDVPNIAFVGFTSSYGQWMITEVASHWISDYFKGFNLLPSREQMQQELVTMRNFARSRFGLTASHTQYYWLEPMEIYLKDMGVPLRRTNNWWTENFGVYRPNRLKTLHEDRRARDLGIPFPNQFYFSFLHFLLILFAILIWIVIRLFK